MEAQEIKELFAKVLSTDNMQAVITCNLSLPVVEISKESCQQAYGELSAMNRRLLRKRVNAYADALAARCTPEAQQQFQMLAQIKKVIM